MEGPQKQDIDRNADTAPALSPCAQARLDRMIDTIVREVARETPLTRALQNAFRVAE